jgi:hypothetical protein
MNLFIITVIVICFFIFTKQNLKNIKNVPSSGPSPEPLILCPKYNTLNPDEVLSIDIEPIGCFTNIYDTFFSSCINPFSKNETTDSGIILTKYPKDFSDFINRAIKNGFSTYGNELLNRYKDNFNLSLIELATLGYINGYYYMSVANFEGKNEIFFSYSPPLNGNDQLEKPDLPFKQITGINGYTNEVENAPGKELSCGYPCSTNDTNQKNVYTCGSILYPNIKTPPRYSVYKIKKS